LVQCGFREQFRRRTPRQQDADRRAGAVAIVRPAYDGGVAVGGQLARNRDCCISIALAMKPSLWIASAAFSGDFAQKLAADWKRQSLQDHIEPVARLVRKRRADREPKVVLSLALHDGEG
jgi:hypothetical protein